MEDLTLEELFELRDKVERAIRDRTKDAKYVSQSACSNLKCTCRFYYPGGMNRCDLNAVPIISDRKLVVSYLCDNGETYQEERKRLIDILHPIRAQRVIVTADHHVGFLTFLLHVEAVRAQQRLENAGLTVNFYCENVKELKGGS